MHIAYVSFGCRQMADKHVLTACLGCKFVIVVVVVVVGEHFENIQLLSFLCGQKRFRTIIIITIIIAIGHYKRRFSKETLNFPSLFFFIVPCLVYRFSFCVYLICIGLIPCQLISSLYFYRL